MAFLRFVGLPGAVDVPGFPVGIRGLPGIRDHLVRLVVRFNHRLLQIAVRVFADRGDAGSGDLVAGDHVSVFILCHLHRPHQDAVADVYAGLVKLRFQNIGHACIGIHHGVALAVTAQMVHDGSLTHCPFLAAVAEGKFCKITLQYLVYCVVPYLG